MTLLQTGSTTKYAENWAAAFGNKPKTKRPATARNGAAAKNNRGQKIRRDNKGACEAPIVCLACKVLTLGATSTSAWTCRIDAHFTCPRRRGHGTPSPST